MAASRPPDHTIQLADGVLHIHLDCTTCSTTAWTHQQVAWFAESIAQQLVAARGITSTPLAAAGGANLASSPNNAGGTGSTAASDLPASLPGSPFQPAPPAASSSSSITQSATPPVSLGKKGPRTRTGCFTCRTKRVKCDEAKASVASPSPSDGIHADRQPICTRCKRNPGRHCVYPKSVSSSNLRPIQRDREDVASVLFLPPPSSSSSQKAHPVLRINRQATASAEKLALMAEPIPNAAQEEFAMFLDGVSFISMPGLLNARPTKQGARARSDRVLAKVWEAQMFVSSSHVENVPGQLPVVSLQAAMASSLVSAVKSLGAVKRAFNGTRPSAVHDVMIVRTHKYVEEAAKVIHDFIHGTSYNDPETILILFELFLLRDCACADPRWSNTHALLRKYIQANGGPAQMLEADRAALLGNSLVEQHLVYLSVYDTFAALTLNLEPYLLSPNNCHWIQDVATAQQVVHADFGFSLQILSCVAKVATLLALQPNDPTSPQSSPASEYPRACRAMYEELEAVVLTNIYSTPSPTRVQFGDLLIRHALLVHLNVVAFGQGVTDPAVQRSASALIELLAEVSIRTGSMVNLLYPMMICAETVKHEDEGRLQVILDFAKASTGLVEIEVLEAIAHEVWRRRRSGEGDMKATEVWNINSPLLIL